MVHIELPTYLSSQLAGQKRRGVGHPRAPLGAPHNAGIGIGQAQPPPPPPTTPRPPVAPTTAPATGRPTTSETQDHQEVTTTTTSATVDPATPPRKRHKGLAQGDQASATTQEGGDPKHG